MKFLEGLVEFLGWIPPILFTVIVAGYVGWFRIIEGLIKR
jgi:hypothetical protein